MRRPSTSNPSRSFGLLGVPFGLVAGLLNSTDVWAPLEGGGVGDIEVVPSGDGGPSLSIALPIG